MATLGRSADTQPQRRGGWRLDVVSTAGPAGLAKDLLDSIFKVATELVRGERASLLVREDATSDFVIAHAVGIADEVKKLVRVRQGEGVVGSVAASKRSLLVRNGEVAPGQERGPQGRYRTASFLSVPILVDDESRGVLNVADPLDGRSFGEDDLITLELLASHIGACLLQQEQGEAMQRLAETDPLTWLFNRRHLDRRPHDRSLDRRGNFPAPVGRRAGPHRVGRHRDVQGEGERWRRPRVGAQLRGRPARLAPEPHDGAARAVSRRARAPRDARAADPSLARARGRVERGRGRERGSGPDDRAALAQQRRGERDLEGLGLRGLSGVQQPGGSRGDAQAAVRTREVTRY